MNTAIAREVVIITGAGNDREKLPDNRWAHRFENVIVVGALNEDGTELWIDMAGKGTRVGPGVHIYAPGKNLEVIEASRTTKVASGTSFATPLVSCVAAMMYGLDGTIRPWEVKDILIKTSDPISNREAHLRRINAYRAISCVSTLSRGLTTSGSHNGMLLPRRYEWNCVVGGNEFSGGKDIQFNH